NGGYACAAADTLVFTDQGLIPMEEVVAKRADIVSDGSSRRRVYDWNIFRDRATVRVSTRRGLSLCGSTTHRVLLADGVTWKRLDELSLGDRIAVGGGSGIWPAEGV